MSAEFEVNGEEFVVITKKEYDRMAKDVDWLMCLEAAGVDNWGGMEVAISMRDGDIDDARD